MATTGSSLEVLSAFTAFISSYLALMRGVRPAMSSLWLVSWNGWSTLVVSATSRPIPSPISSKSAFPTPKRICSSCPVHRRPLFRRNSGTGYSSCGRTSAASPRVSGKDCFPDFYSVPTAEVSSTSPLVKGLRAGRIATSAPNTEAGVGLVRGILSERKCCGMWC